MDKINKIIYEYENLNIIFDIDGTLVYRDNIIEEEVREIIDVLSENNGISLATGRSLNECFDIIKQLNINLPIICFDGQVIFDSNKNTILHNECMNKDDYDLIVSMLNENISINNIFLESLDNIYTTSKINQLIFCKSFNITRNKISIVDSFDKINKINKINRIYVKILDKKNLYNIKKICNRNNFMVKKLSKKWIYISKCSDKSDAFNIMKNLNILDEENTIFFGDGINDINLLNIVAAGCVMDNGNCKAKESATLVVDDVKNGGVYNLLKYIHEMQNNKIGSLN